MKTRGIIVRYKTNQWLLNSDSKQNRMFKNTAQVYYQPNAMQCNGESIVLHKPGLINTLLFLANHFVIKNKTNKYYNTRMST